MAVEGAEVEVGGGFVDGPVVTVAEGMWDQWETEKEVETPVQKRDWVTRDATAEVTLECTPLLGTNYKTKSRHNLSPNAFTNSFPLRQSIKHQPEIRQRIRRHTTPYASTFNNYGLILHAYTIHNKNTIMRVLSANKVNKIPAFISELQRFHFTFPHLRNLTWIVVDCLHDFSSDRPSPTVRD